MSPWIAWLITFFVIATFARRQQRLRDLVTAASSAMIESRADDLLRTLPTLTVLGAVGGATTVSRAWLALQQNDVTSAETHAATAIRGGIAYLPLAAMNRVILAQCAYHNGDTALATNHLKAALAQACPPVTSAAIRTYLQEQGVTLPNDES